mmetsp:Transcript_13380/g.36723  ORF Transcript_13380/g.36723 Transcript_13380/m.36723 type:complete len:281 (+) Transcript_13380:1407-2249(+)
MHFFCSRSALQGSPSKARACRDARLSKRKCPGRSGSEAWPKSTARPKSSDVRGRAARPRSAKRPRANSPRASASTGRIASASAVSSMTAASGRPPLVSRAAAQCAKRQALAGSEERVAEASSTRASASSRRRDRGLAKLATREAAAGLPANSGRACASSRSPWRSTGSDVSQSTGPRTSFGSTLLPSTNNESGVSFQEAPGRGGLSELTMRRRATSTSPTSAFPPGAASRYASEGIRAAPPAAAPARPRHPTRALLPSPPPSPASLPPSPRTARTARARS